MSRPSKEISSGTDSEFIKKLISLGFIPKTSLGPLERLMQTQSNNIEVEMRLGHYVAGDRGVRFVPGVLAADFEHIQRTLLSISTEKDPRLPLDVYRSNTKVYRKFDYLKIEDLADPEGNPPLYMIKHKNGDPVDVEEWGYRIAGSVEENVRDDDPNIPEFPTDEYRIRNRVSFLGRQQSPLHGVRVDLTIVTYSQRNREGNIFIREAFEVELERRRNMSLEDFYETIAFLYSVHQRLSDIYLARYFDDSQIISDKDAIEISKKIVDRFISVSTKDTVIEKFNSYIRGKGRRGLVLHKNEPIDVKVEHLFSMSNYAVTAKLDGKRKLLFVVMDLGVFLLNPPHEIVKIDDSVQGISDAIIDGEFIVEPEGTNLEYYAFDSLVIDGKNIEKGDFEERIAGAQNVMKNLFVESFVFSTKTFYYKKDAKDPIDSFYKSVKKGFEHIETFEDSKRKTDGLILQPLKEKYINEKTYKWKPPHLLTIDFRVSPLEDEPEEFELFTTSFVTEDEIAEEDVDEVMLRFIEGGRGERQKRKQEEAKKRKEKPKSTLQRFKGSDENPYLNVVKFDDGKFNGESVAGRIVEFGWDRDAENFKPLRFRDDKPYPNRTSVALDVWYDINNPVEETTIRGEDVVLMTLFHQNIKEHLLSKYITKRLSLMDIGSGIGQDLKIWKKIGAGKVYAIEPNSSNVEKLRAARKSADVHNIDIIETPVQNTKEIKKAVKNVDNISAFFSPNYVIKDEESAAGLIDTLDTELLAQGYVIGFIFDNVRIKKFVGDNESYENEAFTIEKRGKWRSRVVGNAMRINVRRSGSTEKTPFGYGAKNMYLVDFENLSERFSKLGIDLIPKPLPTTLYDVRDFTRVIGETKTKGEEQTKPYFYENTFIDNGINGLPPASRELSRLVRIIVFRRREEPEITTEATRITGLSRGAAIFETDILRNFVRYSIIPDSSNFFRAIKRATAPKAYLKADDDERLTMALELREQIADLVTPELFEKLGNGFLAKELITRYSDALHVTREVAKEDALARFKSLIRNPDEIVNASLEILEAVSDIMGVNIYLIDATSKKPQMPEAENRGLSLSQKCEILYNPTRKSIVLLSLQGVHFEVLAQGRKGCIGEVITDKCRTLFVEDNEVFQAIRNQLCSQRTGKLSYLNVWTCLKKIYGDDDGLRKKAFEIALKKSDTAEKSRLMENLAFLSVSGVEGRSNRMKIYEAVVRRIDIPKLVMKEYQEYTEALEIGDRLQYLDALETMNESQLRRAIHDRFVGKWFEQYADTDPAEVVQGAYGINIKALVKQLNEDPETVVVLTDILMQKVAKVSDVKKKQDYYLKSLGVLSDNRNDVAVAFMRTMSRKSQTYQEAMMNWLLS